MNHKMAMAKLLREDLFRLAGPTTYDAEGNVDNTYASPGGTRVRLFGSNEYPSAQAWDSTGALLFDLPTVSYVDLDNLP